MTGLEVLDEEDQTPKEEDESEKPSQEPFSIAKDAPKTEESAFHKSKSDVQAMKGNANSRLMARLNKRKDND